MKSFSPKASAALLCVCLAGLSACATYPHDKVTALIMAPYPGRHEIDQCAPYADALFNALKANKVEAWKVEYMCGSWEKTYYHAMIVYRDAGALWYVDNMFPFPTKSWGKTPRECAKDRSERDETFCQVLHVDSTMPDAAATPAATPATAVKQ